MAALSVRNRVVVVAVAAVLAGCAAMVGVGVTLNHAETDEAILDRAAAVAGELDAAGSGGSAIGTQELVGRLVADDDLIAVVVFSPDSEVVTSAPSGLGPGDRLASWPAAEYEIERVKIDGTETAAVAVPLSSGGRAWVVVDLSPFAAARDRQRIQWAVAGSVSILVALALAFTMAGSPVKVLEDVRRTLDRVADGDLDARCTPGGPKELCEVGQSVNRMAARLSTVVSELGEERTALEQQVSGRTRELEQANRLLMDIANRDALTGLANRRRLERDLERNIAFSTRTGQPLAVIMMDLDNFKVCNDTAGHLVGDNILRAVASTLRSRVRVTDLVVRWGGDEFCILVPATQPRGAVAVAESLVDSVKEATSAIALPEGLEPPTASAGVACFPEDGEDPHTLILNADAALYQVKATGRGRALRYSPAFSRD